MTNHIFLVAAITLLSSGLQAQTARVLNTFDSDKEGWTGDFGNGAVFTDGTILGTAGVLTWDSNGDDVGVQDNNTNTNSSSNPGAVGHDFTGLQGLEFDLGMTGPEPVTVNFYTRSPLPSNPNSPDYVSLGDVIIPNDGVVRTYTQNFIGETPVFDVASPASLATTRVYGIYLYDHTAGSYQWSLEEVRSFGTAPNSRVLADFQDSAIDGGIQGALVDFQNAAIVSNDGGNNQTGLSQVNEPGTNGVLQFQSQFIDGSSGGGAIALGNGFFPFASGSGFYNRSLDLSNYEYLEADIRVTGASGAPINVGAYVRETQSFTFTNLGSSQPVDRDNGFQTVSFPLMGVTEPEFLVGYGLFFSEPAELESPVTIQIDQVRAVVTPTSVGDWQLY